MILQILTYFFGNLDANAKNQNQIPMQCEVRFEILGLMIPAISSTTYLNSAVASSLDLIATQLLLHLNIFAFTFIEGFCLFHKRLQICRP